MTYACDECGQTHVFVFRCAECKRSLCPTCYYKGVTFPDKRSLGGLCTACWALRKLEGNGMFSVVYSRDPRVEPAESE